MFVKCTKHRAKFRHRTTAYSCQSYFHKIAKFLKAKSTREDISNRGSHTVKGRAVALK